jgi:alpha-L-rhamnosidase
MADCFLLLLVLLGAATAEPVGAESAKPCDAPSALSCELLLAPQSTVIYDPRPEFAWECGQGEQVYRQSAYQIVVKKVGSMAALWDSGKIESAASVNVEYAGPALEPSREYQWQVRVWNDEDVASDWSTTQKFRLADEPDLTRTSKYDLIAIEEPANSISEISDGHWFVDFDKATFGFLKLKVPSSSEPREVIVHFGEKLRGDSIDRRPGGSIRYYKVVVPVPTGATELTVHPFRDYRNTHGQAIRLPREFRSVTPFRYVEIEGLPQLSQSAQSPKPADITRVTIQYPFNDSAASFKCSDPTLNAIWDMCKHSIKATTFCGVYVDGDRERIPYEADAYINQLCHYGVEREYNLGRYSHEYLLANPTWPTEWKQHSVLMAWADYWHTGNTESLAAYYETLKNEKLLIDAERVDGLLDTSEDYTDIVDWPERERDGYDMVEVNTVINAFHYIGLRRMSQIAEVLGHQSDADEFAAKAEKLKSRFNEALWSDANNAYVDGLGSDHSSLHANLFALAFGLVPQERVETVIDFVKSREMRCSVYAAQYLLEGLYQYGADQYALELLTSKGKRSWHNMIRSGSTIALEAWDKRFKPNLDWNHAWGAAPANLIPHYLVGVQPAAAGFEKLIVQPRPGNLASFSAKVPTICGSVEVNFSRDQGKTELSVATPGNTLTSIGVPVEKGLQPSALTWNGKNVQIVLRRNHAWIDDVPPGRHKMQLIYSTKVARTASQVAAP